jgi:type IV pilus biogenesis protein CpaD/CtpE
MLKLIPVLLIFLVLVVLSGCSTSQKINTLKPEADDAVPLVYENTPSFINLPISVKLKDIENQTNTLLNGLIYEDNNIEDDDIEMKIWKLAPITIENDHGSSGEKIKTILPLKAVIKYRIGTKKLGVALYNTKEFNLNGVVTLISDVGLTNWKLNTSTELKSLDWNESPTMAVFGKNMPVTYLINPAVKLFKSKIEKKIDESISKSMDFKPNVLAALEQICTPFQMSETYESWLRIAPVEIYSTNAKLKNDVFMLEMGMKCNMETLIGKKPESKFNASKIILKPVTKIPQQITANIAAISTYQEASKIMTKNFVGQEFGSGSKKIKVQNVAIWHKDGKMVIALDVLGSVNGTIYLAGFPQYNEQTKEIFFDKLDYALDTKNKLMRTANWLAQGFVLRKIQESCRYSIKPNLEEGKQSMMTYLKNYSPMPGVFVNGKIEDIQFQKIQLTNQAIIAFIKVNGIVNVSVDGLK